MLLYGSVHVGTATATSDIDLCVIFDDLDHELRLDEARNIEQAALTAAPQAPRLGLIAQRLC